MGCFNSRTTDQGPISLQNEVKEELKIGMGRTNIEPKKVGKPQEDPPVQITKAKRNPEKIPDSSSEVLISPPASNKKSLEPNNDSINDMVSNWLNDIYKQSELLILSQV